MFSDMRPVYVLLLTMMAAGFLFLGRKTVYSELKETEDPGICMKGRKIWTILCPAGYAGVLYLFFRFGSSVPAERFLFLIYVYQYSLLVGLVDSFSHNYYLEMLPGLILFIPAGCLTWGFTDAMCGLIAGICCAGAIALTEWLMFRKLSYGGGDAVYGAAASCLAGYSNLTLYWILFAVILLIGAAVHVIYVKAVMKQKIEENRFVPLLPWLSVLTVCFYAFSILIPPA